MLLQQNDGRSSTTSQGQADSRKVIRMNLDDVMAGNTSNATGAKSITDNEIDNLLSRLGRSSSRNSKDNKRTRSNSATPISPQVYNNSGNNSGNNLGKNMGSMGNIPSEFEIGADDLNAIKYKNRRAKSAPPIPEEIQNKMNTFDMLDNIFINTPQKPPSPKSTYQSPTYPIHNISQQSYQPSSYSREPPSYNTALNMPILDPQRQHMQTSNNNNSNNNSNNKNNEKIADIQNRINKVREQINKINGKIKRKGRANVDKKYLDALEDYERKECKYGKMLENITNPNYVPNSSQQSHTINSHNPTINKNSHNPMIDNNNHKHITSNTNNSNNNNSHNRQILSIDMMGDLDTELNTATNRLASDLAQKPRPKSILKTSKHNYGNNYNNNNGRGSNNKDYMTNIKDGRSYSIPSMDLDKKKEQQTSIYSMNNAINELKKRRKFMLEKQQTMQKEYENRKQQISKIKNKQDEVKRLKDLEKERRRIYDMERKMKQLERYQYLQTQKLKEELFQVNYVDSKASTNVAKKAKRDHAIDETNKKTALDIARLNKSRSGSVAPELPLGSPPSKNSDGSVVYPEGYISWFIKELGKYKIGEQVVFKHNTNVNTGANADADNNNISNTNNNNSNTNMRNDMKTMDTSVEHNDNANANANANKGNLLKFKYYTIIPKDLLQVDSSECMSDMDEYGDIDKIKWICWLNVEDNILSIFNFCKLGKLGKVDNYNDIQPISWRVDLGDYLDIKDLSKLDDLGLNEEKIRMLCLLCHDCHVLGGRIGRRELVQSSRGIDSAFTIASPMPTTV